MEHILYLHALCSPSFENMFFSLQMLTIQLKYRLFPISSFLSACLSVSYPLSLSLALSLSRSLALSL